MTDSRLRTLEDYRRVREQYRLEAPEHFNFGYDVVDAWAASQPDTCALWWTGPDGAERRLTFADVSARSSRLATALGGARAQPGRASTGQPPQRARVVGGRWSD